MDLITRIEALLFITARPVPASQLANALDVPTREVDAALEELAGQYQERGFRIQHSKAGYQLVSAPQFAPDIEKFLGLEEIARLSRAALEVLAIIAYQQPITRPQIDSIRGVNSDSVLRTLLRHSLIEEVGRSEGPGRPFLYATTMDFLSYFGLSSLEELPPLQLDTELGLTESQAIEVIEEPSSPE